MEEMSLGSDVSMATGNTNTPLKYRIREFLLPDSSSLDNSDEFPSQTPTWTLNTIYKVIQREEAVQNDNVLYWT